MEEEEGRRSERGGGFILWACSLNKRIVPTFNEISMLKRLHAEIDT